MNPADDTKKPRYFIRNPDSDEDGWVYCGDNTDYGSLYRTLGQFVANEIGNDFGGAHPGDRFTLEVKRVEMTDAEVATLPEM